MKRIILIAVLAAGLWMGGAQVASAQFTAEFDEEKAPAPEPRKEESEPKPEDLKVGIPETSDVDYVRPTYANLARLYWRTNMLVTSVDQNVDNFLLITECDLHKEFSRNDFEWPRMRETTRQYLTKARSTFPNKFEFVQPIELDKYITAKKGFEISEETRYTWASNFQISDNTIQYEIPCMKLSNPLPGYPKDAAIALAKPFSFTFVPVEEKIAKTYLAMTDSGGVATFAGVKRIRPAYIRFRVVIDRFANTVNNGQRILPLFTARLLQIDVFGDKDLLLPMYHRDYDQDATLYSLENDDQAGQKDKKILDFRGGQK